MNWSAMEAIASLEYAQAAVHPATPIASMADQFIVPPLSVLDQRQGYWKERRRRWESYGFRSEVGRAQDLTYRGRRGFHDIRDFFEARKGPGDDSKILAAYAKGRDPGFTHRKAKAERKAGRELTDYEFALQFDTGQKATGTSGFDPVLCELAYRWFCPQPGGIIDPFAGGVTRGAVAWILGRDYHGVDLSEVQVKANRAQLRELQAKMEKGLCPAPTTTPPIWTCADSTEYDFSTHQADLIFTCPPYHIEMYSKNPRDLCNKESAEFLKLMAQVIERSTACLRDDRFSVWVVGNYRDRDRVGAYGDLVGAVVRAHEACGLRLYNDCILVNPVQSVAISGTRHFKHSRKMGKVHQNVLVFVKGDPKKATEAVGQVSHGEIGLQDQAGV